LWLPFWQTVGTSLLDDLNEWAHYYNDGSFTQRYAEEWPQGVYNVPQTGFYTFRANVFFEYRGSASPNQNMDLRLVTCPSTGCSSLPFPSIQCDAAHTVAQSGNTWLNDVPVGGAYPAYNPSVEFTGYFSAGTVVAVCIDNWSTGELYFPLVEGKNIYPAGRWLG